MPYSNQSYIISRSCNEPAEENLLLRELTHRINNEMASTIGFIGCASARYRSEEVKAALDSVIRHISDSALVYRSLQMPIADEPIDAANYLHELCRAISRAKLQHRGIELLFLQSPLKLSAARCWRLGMIVSELINNASRHAFGGDAGKIEVKLDHRGTFVNCTVSDNGPGSDRITPGQGLKIIHALARGLDGTVEHRSGPSGTIAILSFPVRSLAGDLTLCSRDLADGFANRQTGGVAREEEL